MPDSSIGSIRNFDHTSPKAYNENSIVVAGREGYNHTMMLVRYRIITDTTEFK